MTLLEISEKTEDVDMSLDEKIIRQKVIRSGKKKIVKTSDVAGQKVVNGKIKKQSSAETIRRERGQKRGKIKRRAKKSLANARRKRSLKKRTF